MIRIRSPQDFGAACVFFLVGGAGLYFGRDLAFGSPARMGPGFFPLILSWLILGVGALTGLRALAIEGPAVEPPQLRPLLMVCATILAFGLIVERAGLALAAIAVTFLAALARPGVRWRETALLALGLSVFCVLVFVYALSQPMSAFPP